MAYHRRRFRRVPRRPYVPSPYSYGYDEPVPAVVPGAALPVPYYTTQHYRAFDNVAEYLGVCQGAFDGSSQSSPDSWNGNVTLAQARKLGIDGWAEGRERVAKLTGALVNMLSSRIAQHEYVADVSGHYFDLALVLANEPEHWMRPEVLQVEGTAQRHVNILFNGAVSGGVDTKIIEQRGAAVVALCDLLELTGNLVTVQLVFCSGSGDMAVTDLITVKSSSERADLGKLMFWLAHPASLRRLYFAAAESHTEAVRKRLGAYNYGSYGHPETPKLDFTPDLYFGHGGIGASSMWLDETKVREWLEKALAAFGVELATQEA